MPEERPVSTHQPIASVRIGAVAKPKAIQADGSAPRILIITKTFLPNGDQRLWAEAQALRSVSFTVCALRPRPAHATIVTLVFGYSPGARWRGAPATVLYGAMSGDSRFWYLFGGIWLIVGVCFIATSSGANLFADPAMGVRRLRPRCLRRSRNNHLHRAQGRCTRPSLDARGYPTHGDRDDFISDSNAKREPRNDYADLTSSATIYTWDRRSKRRGKYAS